MSLFTTSRPSRMPCIVASKSWPTAKTSGDLVRSSSLVCFPLLTDEVKKVLASQPPTNNNIDNETITRTKGDADVSASEVSIRPAASKRIWRFDTYLTLAKLGCSQSPLAVAGGCAA